MLARRGVSRRACLLPPVLICFSSFLRLLMESSSIALLLRAGCHAAACSLAHHLLARCLRNLAVFGVGHHVLRLALRLGGSLAAHCRYRLLRALLNLLRLHLPLHMTLHNMKWAQ
jgi:hypothetical protein